MVMGLFEEKQVGEQPIIQQVSVGLEIMRNKKISLSSFPVLAVALTIPVSGVPPFNLIILAFLH